MEQQKDIFCYFLIAMKELLRFAWEQVQPNQK